MDIEKSVDINDRPAIPQRRCGAAALETDATHNNGLLFLIWMLGSIFIYFGGITTIGRFFTIEGAYDHYKASYLFLHFWPLTILVSLIVGLFQWRFFRRYVKSPLWLL